MALPKVESDHQLSSLLGRVVEGVGRLISEHIELARLELADEAQSAFFTAARLVAFAGLAAVGYIFLCAAATVALASWLGLGWAAFAIGLGNIIAGAAGFFTAVTKIKTQQVLPDAISELRQSVEVLTPGVHPASSEVTSARY